MLLSCLLVLAVSAAATTSNCTNTRIYVSAYGDWVYSLDYTEHLDESSLSIVNQNTGCAPSPAWVDLDSENHILANGSVSSFQVSEDGHFTFAERKLFPSGPSAGVIYGSGDLRTLAVSHYNGSAISLWDLDSQGLLEEREELFYYQNFTGPNPGQTAPHEHDIILDPTGNFLVVPAHGEDELQIFAINHVSGNVTQIQSVYVAPGSGPRHGVFWSPDGPSKTTNLYFFLLAEITSALTTYNITYSGNTINFDETDVTNSYGGAAVPLYNGPAEIVVSPDNRFVALTNRNSLLPYASLLFNHPNGEYWDNIASFIPMPNGSLVHQQIVPAGGSWPRHLAFNRAGDRVVVSNQGYNRVVVFERDVSLGLFGAILANITVDGQPTCAVWDD